MIVMYEKYVPKVGLKFDNSARSFRRNIMHATKESDNFVGLGSICDSTLKP
jgi:hypothetical protein